MTKIAATPLAKTLAYRKGIELIEVKGSGKGGIIKAVDVETHGKLRYTPLAGRIARELGIDMTKVKGSGYKGKIRKSDLPVFISIEADEIKKETGRSVRKPIQGMRKVIADRMKKSHLSAPPVTLNIKVDVTELLNLRNQVNKTLESSVSINDLVMKAVAQSLREYPNINVTIDGDDIVFQDEVNLGMAVALPDGLIVPVIKNADRLGLIELSAAAKKLGAKAKEDKLTIDEITGGTFTVSNLGMMGITSFTPIINPPESAILGVCAVEENLRLNNGKVESRQIMGLSLTIDHRVIDGAQGAIFLGRIKKFMENPMEIILER
ncbi:MAG: 2-oxo acid dehydrogenase subunit E2 [Gracilibacteraceae bacterium]|nr:2-oxo acid dehydrogenase subunit E2 [Gracilibacteraceae bacterium]